MMILGGVFVVLALALAVFVAATWAPERTIAELRDRWAPPPSVFVDVMGMKVHVRDEGPRDDPSPIVLMHGTGSSLHAWQGWAEALRDKRRVIRFDLAGYGLTGPSPDNLYGGDRDIQLTIAILDRLGVAHGVLGGNSLGGGGVAHRAGAPGARGQAYPRRRRRLSVPIDLDADRLPPHPHAGRPLAAATHAATLPGRARHAQRVWSSRAGNAGDGGSRGRADAARGQTAAPSSTA